MCFLYAPGEKLDERGYWILGIMVVPFFLMILLSLIWREREEPDDEEEDEVEVRYR